MVQLLAVAASVGVAALGALILGEYELGGWTGAVSGALLGAAVAEVGAAFVRRRPAAVITAAVTIAAGFGMLWAVWISTNRFRNPVPFGAAVGVVAAVSAAFFWVRTAGRRGPRTPPVA